MKISFPIVVLSALLLFATFTPLHAAPKSILIEFWDDSESSSTMQFNHDAWQAILTKYLTDQHPSGINRFAYSNVSDRDRVKLDEYISYLQSFDPRQHTLAEQYAYWINLYNAKTVSLVVNRMRREDIESIREIRSGIFTAGPWEKKTMEIAGQPLSLDDIEHGILRPIFKDKRIHFVLNCASLGCPNLSKEAFTPVNLEAQMVKAEKEFLAHPRAVRFAGNKLVLSSLFEWYASDFADDLAGLQAYIKPFVDAYTSTRLSTDNRIDFDYDWGLNKP